MQLATVSQVWFTHSEITKLLGVNGDA